MSTAQALNLLRKIHFLKDLGQEDLLQLAQMLQREEYEPGEFLAQAGDPADGLVFLLQGEISLHPADYPEAGAGPLLTTGDVIGIQEFLQGDPFTTSYRAEKATSAYRWSREDAEAFLNQNTQPLRALQFAADSQVLLQKVGLPWLGEGEALHALARKDINILLQKLSLSALVLFSGLVIAWVFRASGSLFLGLGTLLGVMGLGLGIWQWVDWRNDYYIVTDRRVVWIEKVIGLYDSRQEAPMHMVLSVTVSTDMLGRSLGYGDVIIRTFTGLIPLRGVSKPYIMARIIEQYWNRVQFQRERQDRQAMVEAVRQRLEDPDQISIPEFGKEGELIEEEISDAGERALDRWGFQIRFEDRGVITYRKHWAVLLGHIALPSIALLTAVGLLGARLAGLIQVLRVESFAVLILALLLPISLWWLYQYVDWANDLYQITNERIVDIYKKPLAREEKKVAPLDNILRTEVKRKGILGILLNYGDVIAEVGTDQFTFEGVLNPAEVQQDIVRAQEARYHRKQERERARRQDELVELLGIYHEERHSPKKGIDSKKDVDQPPSR